MAIDSDIRDQAYQFFVQEASELLQVIEAELLTLKTERSTAKVHNLMRAAHSIKGGSACVGLETIKTLAHRLEDIFRALYYENLEIDDQIESLLLQAYDCLRLPLMEEIATGYFNATQAMARAEPVFAQIEAQLGDFLGAEEPILSSLELGIDITLSIFEVDVAQELDRLANVLAHPECSEIAGELRAITEVFTGIAELLNLPGFRAIAQTTIAALDAHPERALHIAQLALADFEAAQQAVVAGDRTQGGAPGVALAELAVPALNSHPKVANLFEVDLPNFSVLPVAKEFPEIKLVNQEETLTAISYLDEVFGISVSPLEATETADLFEVDALYSTAIAAESAWEIELADQEETLTGISSLDEVLGLSVSPPQTTEIADLREVDKLNSTPLTAAEETWEIELVTQEEQVLSANDDDIFDTSVWNAQFEEIPDVFGVDISEPWVLRAAEEIPEVEPDPEETDPDPIPNIPVTPVSELPQELHSDLVEPRAQDSIQKLVQSIEQVFDSLPSVTEFPANNGKGTPGEFRFFSRAQEHKSTRAFFSPHQPSTPPALEPAAQEKNEDAPTASTPYLSVKVDLDRLERMNNLVGELAINRNSLSLQNEQLQGTVQELLQRFERFQKMANHLRDLSDQMLVAPHRHPILPDSHTFAAEKAEDSWTPGLLESLDSSSQEHKSTRAQEHSSFDSLEMDSYGELHSLLQDTLEEMVQLEEIVGDVALVAGQSSQTLESQRQMIGHLRDDLMWARMLPLSKVLSRFPRNLRDLSTTYQKPVDLKLSGTGVLVDKAALEKLYDPLLHLLRNAFDHGIEPPEVRRQQGKPERGQIEIRAYHQGSQTIIEVRDDGQGINHKRIRSRAEELGFLSSEQLAATSTDRLLDVLFEPGFSTAFKVSELSGRGVGLDVVRSQLRSLKGNVTVTSTPGRGTTFTLRIPLTLTIAKLLVCLVGTGAYAFPADSIEEILIPKADQVKRTGKQKYLHWRQQIVPIYHLSELLDYAVPLPESIQSLALVAVPSPEDWAPPMLLIRQDNQFLALEIDRLVTEQELVIKPFGEAIAPPSYIYGCTILGDGSLIPVIDGATLINQMSGQGKSASTTLSDLPASTPMKTASTGKTKVSTIAAKSPLVLIVDDSIALRQTLALTLQKAGYRVLQARDGREAIEQLQQNSSIQIVVCDIEMPNMNGFDFLSHRRQDPLLSTIPIVMLTSRSSEKHRRLATHLGANAYFTKPYLDQEFLAALKNIIDLGGKV